MNTDIFEEIPILIKDFIISPYHMNFPTISERQLRMMEFMVGDDITKVFDNGHYLAIACWGKGSGKDHCVVLMFCYLIYYLLCLKNPQKFFNLGLETDSIDMLNMAINRDQAQQVFFEKLRNQIKNWKWLKDKYKVVSTETLDVENKVIIRKSMIQFPKHINLYSGCSEADSVEGKNLIAFALDEASGFATTRTDKATEIYGMLKSSAVSRFGLRHKGFIISFPRAKDDFTINKFIEYMDNLNVYTDKGATWEVKPSSCFSGKYFRFKDEVIPIEFKEEFDSDPFGSMMRYMCIPAEVENPFFELPEKIDKISTRQPIITCDTVVEGNYIKKKIINWNYQCPHTHVIGIDLGRKSDSASLSAVHFERIDGHYKYVQDLLLTWVPDRTNELLVSFTNIGQLILELAQKMKISCVVFDQWNSATLIEELNSKGIISYDITLSRPDYAFLKELIYSGRIELICDANQILELKKLIILKSNKVDHLPQYSKDSVDSLVSAIKILQEYYRNDTAIWGDISEDFIDPSKGGFIQI